MTVQMGWEKIVWVIGVLVWLAAGAAWDVGCVLPVRYLVVMSGEEVRLCQRWRSGCVHWWCLPAGRIEVVRSKLSQVG